MPILFQKDKLKTSNSEIIPIIISREIPKVMINTLEWFNIKNHKIFLTMSLNLDQNILWCPISLFLFFWYEMNIRYFLFKINLLYYIWIILLYHRFVLLFLRKPLFFQNCWGLFTKYSSKCVFFRLRIGAIYHEKNIF